MKIICVNPPKALKKILKFFKKLFTKKQTVVSQETPEETAAAPQP